MNLDEKSDIILQIARKFRTSDNQIDYLYEDDLKQRQDDYEKAKCIKIAHVSSDDRFSRGYIKST